MDFNFSYCSFVRLGRNPASFFSERELFRRYDGVDRGEFRVGVSLSACGEP